jgi:type 1 fimbria pilin
MKLVAAVLLWLCAATAVRADEAVQCQADGGSYLTGTVTAGPSFSRGHSRRGVELSHTHLTLLSDQNGQSYDVAMDNVFASGFDSVGENVPPPLSSIRVGDHLGLCGQLYADGRLGIHFVHTNCGDRPTERDPGGWVKLIAENGTPGPNLEDSREYCGLWP